MKDFVVKIKNKMVQEIKSDKKFYTGYFIGVMFSILFYIFFDINVDTARAVGVSNNPTIKENDIIYSLNYAYSVKNDDFVIVSPDGLYGLNMCDDIIKRVVAVEGDHVVIKDGNLYINGVQDYMAPDYYYYGDVDIIIPDNCYYLLGDNRANSYDSRKFGVVNRNQIKGKVIWHGKRLVDRIKGN